MEDRDRIWGSTVFDEDDVCEMISLDRIRRNRRRKIDEKKVERLREAVEMGRDIRPVLLSRLGDGTYRIVGDGRHRCEAHLRAGCTYILARIVNTSRRRSHVRSLEVEHDKAQERKS